MINKFIAGLTGCLAIFCVAAGHNSGSSLNAKAESLVPVLAPGTIQVRLVHVETNADVIDSPVAGSNITIQAGAARFTKQTNKNGVALFDAVPCGGEIDITVQGTHSDERGVFHRRLTCQGVYSGVITNPFGTQPVFEQRRAQFMGYDAVKEVWRTEDGRVVPNRIIRRRLARYGIGAHAAREQRR